MPGRHGEAADVIGDAGLLRRDEIGERSVGAVAGRITRDLLAQRVQASRAWYAARSSGVELDVVADAVRRPETDHRICRHPFLGDHALQQRLRVCEQLLGLRANLVVIEDRRITPGQLPGLEERRPIDVRNEPARSQFANALCP